MQQDEGNRHARMLSILFHYTIISLAVIAVSAAQVLIKHRLNWHGHMPAAPRETFMYIINLIFDPVVVGAFILLVGAAITWYFVVSRIPLSTAFAFAALSYPIVLLGAFLFLREPIGAAQIVGNALIVIGIIVVASAGRAT